jgi:hypothetical protein
MQMLPAVAKAGIVVGGYVTAILAALCVVTISIHQASGFDRDASAGMHAFGDSLLFIAVFGVVSSVRRGQYGPPLAASMASSTGSLRCSSNSVLRFGAADVGQSAA